MGCESRIHTADRLIAIIAAKQFGALARWQLLQAGLTPREIQRRVEGGRLHEIHRGVYLTGHATPAPYAREMAALLACGEGASVKVRAGKPILIHTATPAAVLSHRSAASLWNLIPYPAPGDVCVTSPHGRGATRTGIEVHRATVSPRDIRRRHGMPLTSPPRTILDLAATLASREEEASADPLEPQPLDELERIGAEAHFRRRATDAELRDQLARNPNRPGVRALRTVLDLPGGPRRTRSPGERALLRLLRRREITGYETNADVAGHEVDFLWRELRFAVEVDGWDAHSGRIAFERDRLKVAVLNANGISVMPVTGRQIRRDPEGVIAGCCRPCPRGRQAAATRLRRVNRGARGQAG
jgi:very-short-patch-repair endonuclease